MSRSWITGAMIIVSGLLAFVVASPLGARFGSDWLPAINFAVGGMLVLVAFLETGRALEAWLNRRATIGWIIGGLIVAGGMLAAGISFIIHARHMAYDTTITLGIIVSLLGLQLQSRAGNRKASPA
jgi:hypothetical protein